MITLVLGGARSGKSLVAEGIAGSYGAHVTYVATAAPAPGDADHMARIAAHQARRTACWATVECTAVPDLARHLRRIAGVALVDSLGTWVTLQKEFDVGAETGGLAEAFCAGSCRWLLAWLAPVAAGLFFVTGALGPIAVGVAVLTCVGIVVLAKRRLGGFTGDVLGAVIILSETTALLTLAAAP